MSARTLVSNKRSLTMPLLGALVILLVTFLFFNTSENWIPVGSPSGKLYQLFTEVLFFLILLVAPVLLAVKTTAPIWFIGLICGFVTTAIIQSGIRTTPDSAEAIGALLSGSFIIQSLVSTVIALVSRFVSKRFALKSG